jgi:hypothetical protein
VGKRILIRANNTSTVAMRAGHRLRTTSTV